ncbi:MAG: DegT/DnrJ/EryC1/StrS family aminotransferase, partial [Candidatus Latescibacterota bacterium]|nr:DegT/DnrJ/EryC1/StrS family aminotransferase [Candidatus Latescibacterota bacterium]
ARSFVNLGNGTQTGQLGPNLRMGEMHGALALVRMKRVDAENVQRRKNADHIRIATTELPGLRSIPAGIAEGVYPVYYNYIFAYVFAETGISRSQFAKAVQAEGIPLRCGFYQPLNLLPVFTNLDAWPYRLEENRLSVERGLYGEGKCPVGEAFMAQGHLELKMHPPASAREMGETVEAIKKVIENAGDLVGREVS